MQAPTPANKTSEVTIAQQTDVSSMTTVHPVHPSHTRKLGRLPDVIYYDLITKKGVVRPEDQAIYDLVIQQFFGYYEDRPIEHLPDWLQERCHEVMKEFIWPRFKMLSDRPIFDLRQNQIMRLMFYKLGWKDGPANRADRKRYWVSIERYIIYWMCVTQKRIAKNVRIELNRESKLTIVQ